jgi:hypothetical protein
MRIRQKLSILKYNFLLNNYPVDIGSLEPVSHESEKVDEKEAPLKFEEIPVRH